MCDINTPDDMTSFEILHTQNGPERVESFDSAEYSFIPGHPVAAADVSGNGHVNGNFDMTNMQSAFMSATPDLSMDEVHQRLVQLLEENATMKDALKKNNSMMQEQLSTISAWHEQMTLTKSKQQISLENAKRKIADLEKENAELYERVKNLESKCQTDPECETCTKHKTLETLVHSLQEEKDCLLKEKNDIIKELKAEKTFHKQLEQNVLEISIYLDHILLNHKLLEAEKKELTALNNALQLRLSTISTDFETITHTDEETGYEVVHQKTNKDDTVKQSLLDFTVAQDEIEELKKKVQEQEAEIESLKTHSEELCKKISLYEQEQKDYETASKNSYEVSQNKLVMVSSLAEKYKERCDSLQQQVDDYQKKVEEMKISNGCMVQHLQDDIQKLQQILKQKECSNQEDREKLSQLQVHFNKVEQDYVRVSRLLEVQSKEQKEKAEQFDTMREVEGKQHLEQIDTLTAQLFDTQQKLEEKEEKIKELTSELSTVKEGTEIVPILKAQVEVYKVDLENAVSARESAHEEVERLTNELRKWQSSSPCRNCGHSLANTEVKSRFKIREKSRSGSRRTDEQTTHDSVFVCPLCGFGFTDYRALENHVNNCIDSHEKDT